MGPIAADIAAFEELFSCGICGDFFHEPVTNTCCGKSFCLACLRGWIKRNATQSGITRCPAGCDAKLPYVLPSCTLALKAAMQQLVPAEVKRRRDEQELDDAEEDDMCYGGFKAWQVVHAAQNLYFGCEVGVRQGTPGILICNCNDGSHVTVKFETREDGSELSVNVLPNSLMNPLPGGFRLGQKVVASSDLFIDGVVAVQLGTVGVIVQRADENLMYVLFEERADDSEGPIGVQFTMICADRLLAGGFKIGQKVQASLDFAIDSDVFIPLGTSGTIIGEYSDTRLTVAFAREGQDASTVSHTYVNVLPFEIRDFSDAVCDIPLGQAVRALTDLSKANVQVPAGTRGVVHSFRGAMKVVVAFDGNEEMNTMQYLTVPITSIEKIPLMPITSIVARFAMSDAE